MKTRAWIENGVIRCCSQMCEAGPEPCPKIGFCKVVDVAIGRDSRMKVLEKLAETAKLYRIANYEAREVLEREIDSLLRELDAGERE